MRKTKFQKTALTLLCALQALYTAHAATYYVDAARTDDTGDGLNWSTAKQSIQAAVDLAVNGDTVLVTNGTYATDSVIPTGETWPARVYTDQAITLESVNGPEFTIIYGAQEARCVYLHAAAKLDGFTLTDGCAGTNELSSGGGLVAYSTAEDPVFVTNCIIRNCQANKFAGGALLQHAIMTDCTLAGNTSESYAGGAYLADSTLKHCTIEENFAAEYGGGIYATDSVLEFCEISDNTSGTSAGGLMLSSSTALSCQIADNTSVSGGACHLFGDALNGTASELNSCLVSGNHSESNAVITFSGGSLNFCTIADNEGNGIASGADEVNSCIIWDNTPENILGYSANTHHTCSPDLGESNGCITNAPSFHGYSYSLTPDSPCLSQGDGTDAPDYDLDGRPRNINGPDMGAYEAAFFVFVDASQPDDSGNGILTNTAKRTLQAGAELAADIIDAGTSPFVDVWVAPGTYAENGATAPGQTHTNRLVVPANVRFLSTAGKYETFIEGSNLVRGLYACSNAYAKGFTIQNGITAAAGTDAECSGGGAYLQSGALLIDCSLEDNVAAAHGGGAFLASDAQIQHCGTDRNRATLDGGGIYLSSNGSVRRYSSDDDWSGRNGGGIFATHAIVENIWAWSSDAANGGGIYLTDHSSLREGRISYCDATNSGGGAYLSQSTMRDMLVMDYCEAGEHGGAIYLTDGSHVRQIYITGNDAQQYGGGIYAKGANQIARCTLESNEAQRGGGAYLNGTSSIGYTQMDHVLVDRNTASDSKGAGVCINNSGTLRNCTIIENDGIGLNLYTGKSIGIGLVTGPYVYNTIVWGNRFGDIATFGPHQIANTCARDGVDHLVDGCITIDPLLSGSLLSSNSPCINRGDDTQLASATDAAGNPRIQSAASDLGAYESNWDTQTADLDLDGLPDTWETNYFLSTHHCARDIDTDGDGYSNFDEYLIGSNPTNGQSKLTFTACAPSEPTAGFIELHWTKHPTEKRNYLIEWAPSLTNDFQYVYSTSQRDSYIVFDDDLHESETFSSGFFHLTVKPYGSMIFH